MRVHTITSEVILKKEADSEVERRSGLFLGSEPISEVHDRRTSGKGDDDRKDGDKADDDSTDSDKRDSDSVDKGDGGDDSRDSDGRD
jgi:hypothetical protein